MQWIIVDDAAALAETAATIMLDTISRDPNAVLGLPTGSTPLGMYSAVVARCRIEQHCFRDVVTFNLDEYAGITPDHPSSYHAYMRDVLFNHVDLDPSNTHIPDGSGRKVLARHPDLTFDEALELECGEYEDAIRRHGSLQLTFLGLGRNGHIGFNEPGTSFRTRTHVVTLTESTRQANAEYFPGSAPPKRALTVGIGTILESAGIVLMAAGAAKQEAIARLRSGEIDESFPASALHRHHDVRCIVDRAAAGE